MDMDLGKANSEDLVMKCNTRSRCHGCSLYRKEGMVCARGAVRKLRETLLILMVFSI